MAEPLRTIDRLRAMAPTISVGITTADMLSLGSEIAAIESAGVQVLHFDVMDGVFCPMLTYGAPFVKGIRTGLLKDVHLMVHDPLPQLEAFVSAGADILTIHVEGMRHPHRALQALAGATNANDPGRGLVRGVALNPGTPLEVLDPLLLDVEMITLLAVNPGWGGQRFIPTTRPRVQRVLEKVRDAKRDILVCIDGGVKQENIQDIAHMRPDLIVTGSAVFDGGDAAANARKMLDVLAARVTGTV